MLVALGLVPAMAGRPAGLAAQAADGVSHLLISEVMTGGASASDEFVELYNPTSDPLPLEGLELIYASASGTTVSRRAAWAAGAPSVPPGGHHLVANDAGVFAGIGDALYAGGMAASGGSVALRIQGAAAAIDAVGWGTAAAWLEGPPAVAPAPGESLERLPGGEAGSATDTDQNAVDFVIRALPDPQNASSPPVPPPTASPSGEPTPPATPSPTAAPDPTPTPTVAPTVEPTPVPSAGPSPAPSPISEARARPDGSLVTVRGVSLSSSSFTDGGGFVADGSGGIAVLPDADAFPRGVELTVTGEIDDRYSQRTLRVAAGDIGIGPALAEPGPLAASTGSIGEGLEGRLVRIRGAVQGGPTELASGLAYDLDDGSGPVRVLVAPGTGVDTAGWAPGAALEVVGIASQRDTTGSGVAGYRVLPRDGTDVTLLAPPATPSPSASPSPGAGPAPSPGPDRPGDELPLVSVAEARAAETGTRLRVRGTVTMGSGLIDASTAVIQDGSGGILLRLGGEAGRVRRGETLEVAGTRSTRSGMLSIRVTQPPRRLGGGAEPAPRRIATGEAAERLEAQLVVVRGAVVANARRSSAGSVTLDIDDGSGPLRVHLLAALGADREALVSGAWIEVSGVLGQQTTGAQPDRGYRLWPRSTDEVSVLAAATAGAGADAGAAGPHGGDERASGGDERDGQALDGLLPGAPAGRVTAAATLVAAGWPELGVAGVLWDGSRAIGLADDASGAAAVAAALRGGAPPTTVRVTASRAVRRTTALELPVVALPDARALVPAGGRPRPPLDALPGDGVVAWVRVTGRIGRDGPGLTVAVGERRVLLSVLCRDSAAPRGLRPGEVVELEGLAHGSRTIGVPCGGLRRAPALLAAAGTAATTPPAARGAAAPARPGVQAALLPLLLGGSSAGAAALLGAAAWRQGAFGRLHAALLGADDGAAGDPRSAAAGAAAGDEDGDRPPEPEPPRDDGGPPPRLTVVHAPPGSGR